MNTKLSILLILFFTLNSFSQSEKGNEITVEGNAKIYIKPDIATFKISINKKNDIAKTAIKELNEEIQKLQQVLFKIGFTNKNIKIAEYKISTEQYRNEKKEYNASNSLSIEFGIDNKLIDLFYQEIQLRDFKDLDIEFETQISNELEKSTRKKLVQLAIADAKSNAENIATELKVKLNNIKKVGKYENREFNNFENRVNEVNFIKPNLAVSEKTVPKTSFDNFEVENIPLKETITIIYEIIKI
ncbi:MAG: SIMPL domain-containing protein [Flavobacterium sp.]